MKKYSYFSPIQMRRAPGSASEPDPQGDSRSVSELAPARGLALQRREFLRGAGGAVAVGRLALGGAAAVAGASALAPKVADALALAPATGRERQVESFKIRLDAAKQELRRPPVHHPTNGDEERFPNRIGNFSKTLPHNELGEVDPAAYDALLEALEAGDFKLMEQVPRAGGRFTNPLGGLAFTLEGPDTAAVELNPPPSIASPEWAADLAELYWMALLRDVPFSEYDSHPLAREACGESGAVVGLLRVPAGARQRPVPGRLPRRDRRADGVAVPPSAVRLRRHSDRAPDRDLDAGARVHHHLRRMAQLPERLPRGQHAARSAARSDAPLPAQRPRPGGDRRLGRGSTRPTSELSW
jgi:hypothetical protein